MAIFLLLLLIVGVVIFLGILDGPEDPGAHQSRTTGDSSLPAAGAEMYAEYLDGASNFPSLASRLDPQYASTPEVAVREVLNELHQNDPRVIVIGRRGLSGFVRADVSPEDVRAVGVAILHSAFYFAEAPETLPVPNEDRVWVAGSLIDTATRIMDGPGGAHLKALRPRDSVTGLAAAMVVLAERLSPGCAATAYNKPILALWLDEIRAIPRDSPYGAEASRLVQLLE